MGLADSAKKILQPLRLSSVLFNQCSILLGKCVCQLPLNPAGDFPLPDSLCPPYLHTLATPLYLIPFYEHAISPSVCRTTFKRSDYKTEIRFCVAAVSSSSRWSKQHQLSSTTMKTSMFSSTSSVVALLCVLTTVLACKPTQRLSDTPSSLRNDAEALVDCMGRTTDNLRLYQQVKPHTWVL